MNQSEEPISSLIDRIAALEHLVTHCWLHSMHKNCGYMQMSTEMKRLYDEIVGSPADDATDDA